MHSILIVDDDPDIHDLLTAALTAKYFIDHAYDGLQGLHALESKPVDLVITDIRMPQLDGLELLKRIRQVRPGTKVLVMTAESTPTKVITSLRDHAYAYFRKPFSLNVVSEIVDCALSSSIAEGDIEIISAIPRWISMQLRCKLEVADRITPFLQQMETDLSTQERDDIGTAFRELLMNAIEHGGRSDPDMTVRVDYVRTARSIIYKVWDPGQGFSFDDLRQAAISNGPDAPFKHLEVRDKLGLRAGGFGILLTRQLADELIYNQTGNEVLLIKYLDKRAAQQTH
jgi:DNA-binding response OmpR family regulator